MATYRFKHYRRLAPLDSPEETLLTTRSFEADSPEQALIIKDGLIEGFNPGTDFAELRNERGETLWQEGCRT